MILCDPTATWLQAPIPCRCIIRDRLRKMKMGRATGRALNRSIIIRIRSANISYLYDELRTFGSDYDDALSRRSIRSRTLTEVALDEGTPEEVGFCD